MTTQATPRPQTARAGVAAAGVLRPVALLRATPLLAWALVASFVLLGLVHAIAVPLLHGPDEGAHVDRIATIDLADQLRVDPRGDLRYSPDLLAAYAQVGIVPVDHRVLPRIPWTPLNTADAVPTGERPSYPDLAPPGRADARFVNAARSHPPGYYVLVDAVDAGLEALGMADVDEAPWDNTIARWRLLSAFLLAPIPWAAFWIGLRLSRRRLVGFTAATFTLAVPQLSHAAGTVNNDALLLTGTTLCALAVTWMATGDRSRRTAVIAGLGAGLAVFSKIFGIAAPLWIVVAAWAGIRARRGRPEAPRRALVENVALAGIATVVAGGWFPVLAFLRYGTVAPRGFGYAIPDVLETSVATWLREAVERLTSTGFGRFGVEQFGIPGWSVWLASLLLVALVAIGLASVRHVDGLAAGAAVLLPLLTTGAMVCWAAWNGYARSGVPSGLHGRYLFVAAPGLAALAAIGLHRAVDEVAIARGGGRQGDGAAAEQPSWRGLLGPAVAAGLAVLLQGLGLVTELANWWPGGWSDRVRTAMLLSGWSDPFLAGVLVIAIGVGAALVVGVRRETSIASPSGAPT